MDSLSCAVSTVLAASRAKRSTVLLSPRGGGNSHLVRSTLRLLCREGYIVAVFEEQNLQKKVIGLRVILKYSPSGTPAVTSIYRISTPGRRVHLPVAAL